MSASLLLGLGYAVIGILEPLPIKWIFDGILAQEAALPGFFFLLFGKKLDSPWGALAVCVGSIVAMGLARGVCYYYQQLFASHAGQQIASRVRQDLYAHLHRLSLPLHPHLRLGEAISLLIADVKSLREMLVSTSSALLREVFLSLGMLLAMFWIDAKLTLIGSIVIPALFLLLKSSQSSFVNEVRNQRREDGSLTGMASEALGGIRVIQGFQKERQEVRQFEHLSQKLLSSFTKASHLLSRMRCTSETTMTLATAFVLIIAGNHTLEGCLTPGDMLVFIYYLRAFGKPLKKIATIAEKMTKGSISGGRIMRLMSNDPPVQESKRAVEAPALRGKIVFENVSYTHSSGRKILNAINLELMPGEHIALKGPCGSGKSTLASLIPRFYDPTAGRVLIDDQDIRNFTLSSLRQQISFVFQDPLLFTGTIRENIAYGNPKVNPSEIQRIAEMLGLHQKIISLPKGYETPVGQGGGCLSGGQKQCIAIARALIKNAPIVIMDEPTSALDMQSAECVGLAVREYLKERTVIIITHQDLWDSRVDRIIEVSEK